MVIYLVRLQAVAGTARYTDDVTCYYFTSAGISVLAILIYEEKYVVCMYVWNMNAGLVNQHSDVLEYYVSTNGHK